MTTILTWKPGTVLSTSCIVIVRQHQNVINYRASARPVVEPTARCPEPAGVGKDSARQAQRSPIVWAGEGRFREVESPGQITQLASSCAGI